MDKYLYRISNSSYDHLTTLSNTHADGLLVEEAFKELGYKCRAETDLSLAATSAFLGEFCKLASSDRCALAVFYYTGHGVEDVTQYLVPTNGRYANPQQVIDTCFRYGDIATGLIEASCPVVLILDCCRMAVGQPQAFRVASVPPVPTDRVFALFGCAVHGEAFDNFDGQPGGPVARFLVQALRAGPRPTIGSVLKSVEQNVRNFTTVAAGGQAPRLAYLQRPQLIDPEHQAANWRWDGTYDGQLQRPPLIRDWTAAASAIRPSAAQPDFASLNFYNEPTRFIESEPVLSSFQEFVNAGERLSVLALTGEGGAGKSRFCHEMCRTYRSKGCSTGFLNYLSPNLSTFRWADWVPDRDYVIVVDDCNEREAISVNLLTELPKAAIPKSFKVRIVLVDQKISPAIQEALASIRSLDDARVSLHAFPYPKLEEKQSRLLYIEAMKRFSATERVDVSDWRMSAAQRSYASGNPLDILLNALWFASTHPSSLKDSTRYRELSHWLYQQKHEAARARGAGERHDFFAALVTICGGMAKSAWPTETQRTGRLRLGAADAALHDAYVDSGLLDYYLPLKPERLGEAFVYETLFFKNTRKAHVEECVEVLEAAWGISPMRTANFLLKLAQNYRYDTTIEPLLKSLEGHKSTAPAAVQTLVAFKLDLAQRFGLKAASEYIDLYKAVFRFQPVPPALVTRLIRIAPRETDASDAFEAYIRRSGGPPTRQMLEALSQRAGKHVSLYLAGWLGDEAPPEWLLNNLIEKVDAPQKEKFFAYFDGPVAVTQDRTIANFILYGSDAKARDYVKLAATRGLRADVTLLSKAFSLRGPEAFFDLLGPLLAANTPLIHHASIQKLLYNQTFQLDHFFQLVTALGDNARRVITEKVGSIAFKKCQSFDEATRLLAALLDLGRRDNSYWVSARARFARDDQLLALARTVDLAPELVDDHVLTSILRGLQRQESFDALPAGLKSLAAASRDPSVVSQFLRFAGEREFAAILRRIQKRPALVDASLAAALMRSTYCTRPMALELWSAIEKFEQHSAGAYAAYLRHVDDFAEVARRLNEMRDLGLEVGAAHVAHAVRTAPDAESARKILNDFVESNDWSGGRARYRPLLSDSGQMAAAIEALDRRGIEIDIRHLVEFIALLPDAEAVPLLERLTSRHDAASRNLFVLNLKISKLARDTPEQAIAVFDEIDKAGHTPDRFSYTPLLPHITFAQANDLLVRHGMPADADLAFFNAWMQGARTRENADTVLLAMGAKRIKPDHDIHFAYSRNIAREEVVPLLRRLAANPSESTQAIASNLINIHGAALGIPVLDACAELGIRPSIKALVRLGRSLPLEQMPQFCDCLDRLDVKLGAMLLAPWLDKVSTFEQLCTLLDVRDDYPFSLKGEDAVRLVEIIESEEALREFTARLLGGQKFILPEMKAALRAKAAELMDDRTTYFKLLKGGRTWRKRGAQ